jgi:hypothetical protein
MLENYAFELGMFPSRMGFNVWFSFERWDDDPNCNSSINSNWSKLGGWASIYSSYCAVKTRAPDELPLPSPTNDTQIYREMSIGLEAPEVVPVHPLKKPWGTCMSIHFGPLWKDLFKSFKSSLYLVLQKTMTKQPVLQPVGNSFPPQVWYIWCSYDSIRYSIRLILSILEILSASRARTL